MSRRGDFGGARDARHAAAGISGSLGAARSAGAAERAALSGNARGSISVRRATLGDLPIIVELRLALLRENADHPVYGQLRADARERAYDVFGAQLRSPQEIMFL